MRAPEPGPESTDPTVACAKCESTAVYATDTAEAVCMSCGAVLEVGYTEVTPG